jgi:hypothetical protein
MVVDVNVGLSNMGMGGKFSNIAVSVPSWLASAVNKAHFLFKTPLKFYTGVLTGRLDTATAYSYGTDLRWTYRFAGFVWGIFALIINLVVSSLPLVVWAVAGSLIYLGLKPEAVPQQAAPEAEKKE